MVMEITSNRMLCLGAQTALLFWRAVRENRLRAPNVTDDIALPKECVASYRDLSKCDLDSLGIWLTREGIVPQYDERLTYERHGQISVPVSRLVPQGLAASLRGPMPVHLLVPDDAHHHCHSAIVAHRLSGELPPGSLYRIDERTVVASPELAYAQTCLPYRDLPNIELALELCGRYALAPAGMRCQFDQKSLTTASKLKEFLAHLGARRHVQAAQRAMEWVVDDMASPRETEVFLIAVLPPKGGGFGLPFPSVNVRVPLSNARTGGIARQDWFEVDLLWVERKVVLEYDGYDDHEADLGSAQADKERRSVLAALGYTVIVITRRDMESVDKLRAKFEQVALALGATLPHFSDEEFEAHKNLLRWLGNPLHDHLPFGCGYH